MESWAKTTKGLKNVIYTQQLHFLKWLRRSVRPNW